MRELTTKLDKLGTIRCTMFDTQPEVMSECKKHVRNWMGDWMGGSQSEVERKFTSGDESLVKGSDKIMTDLEGKFDVPTSRYRVFDAVAGGVPNVPAYLANQPMAMRVRRRVKEELAPLTIVVDLTSSGGIKADYLAKRGVAILALVRLLSAVRPVTLWAGSCMGSNASGIDGEAAWYQLDSSPMDLARCAFHFSAAGVARGFLYSLFEHKYSGNGHWAFDDVTKWRNRAPRFLEQWIGGEILYVPAVHLEDEFKNPAKWLEQKLREYGGELIEQ